MVEVAAEDSSGRGTNRTKRRKRRSSAEVRDLIITAARDLFARRGYPATTTRDIAIEAGVNEATIYRHFGSKPQLFETAVGEPYHQFMNDYMTEWTKNNPQPKSGEEVVGSFVEGLYGAFLENRDLILAFICAQRFERLGLSSSGDQESVVSRELRAMDEWAQKTSDRLQFYDIDIPVTLRCSVAMVMSLALHEDLLFEPGPNRPSRARILRETTTYMYRALATRRVDLDSE
jgi:AcrR family transcriptional regulator